MLYTHSQESAELCQLALEPSGRSRDLHKDLELREFVVWAPHQETDRLGLVGFLLPSLLSF